MSYRFEAGRIYRMPTHFGPAFGPRQVPDDVVVDPKRSPRRLSVAASFLTDPVALEQHLPEGFTLAGEPVVTVEFHHMTDIDWLAGRGYTMIWVSWPATFTGSRDRATGKFRYVDGQLAGKDYLMGKQFTVADGYMYTMLRWADGMKFDLSGLSNLMAYKDRVGARPKVQEALTKEGLMKAA